MVCMRSVNAQVHCRLWMAGGQATACSDSGPSLTLRCPIAPIQVQGPEDPQRPPRVSAQALSSDSRQAASLPAASHLGDPEIKDGEESRPEGPHPKEWRSQVTSQDPFTI